MESCKAMFIEKCITLWSKHIDSWLNPTPLGWFFF